MRSYSSITNTLLILFASCIFYCLNGVKRIFNTSTKKNKTSVMSKRNEPYKVKHFNSKEFDDNFKEIISKRYNY